MARWPLRYLNQFLPGKEQQRRLAQVWTGRIELGAQNDILAMRCNCLQKARCLNQLTQLCRQSFPSHQLEAVTGFQAFFCRLLSLIDASHFDRQRRQPTFKVPGGTENLHLIVRQACFHTFFEILWAFQFFGSAKCGSDLSKAGILAVMRMTNASLRKDGAGHISSTNLQGQVFEKLVVFWLSSRVVTHHPPMTRHADATFLQALSSDLYISQFAAVFFEQ